MPKGKLAEQDRAAVASGWSPGPTSLGPSYLLAGIHMAGDMLAPTTHWDKADHLPSTMSRAKKEVQAQREMPAPI